MSISEPFECRRGWIRAMATASRLAVKAGNTDLAREIELLMIGSAPLARIDDTEIRLRAAETYLSNFPSEPQQECVR